MTIAGKSLLRSLRHQTRRLAAGLRWGRAELAHAPVLFANSFPKSGTHLLTQVMEGFSQIGPAVVSGLPAVVTFQGDTGQQRSEAQLLQRLQALRPGDLAYGHLHALPALVDLLSSPGFAAWFILRDPRDVVVSHVHYVTEMEPRHVHHTYYRKSLENFDQRLSASILGFAAQPGAPQPLPDIRQRFEPYLGWLGPADRSVPQSARPEIQVLRYEDLLNARMLTLEQILDHATRRGFKPHFEKSRAIELLSGAIAPLRSPTFRTGKSGGWKEAFTQSHKDAFKQVAGDLLIQLGYEENNDW